MIIRDNINTGIIAVEPAVFTIYNGAIDAYVWQLNNGYLVITVRPIKGIPWYDQYINDYIEITDINHISYLKNMIE
ncbi:MAG: hypothetical protein IKJ91_00890 [Clostridia bacterium]|nr:hypothetical protein [Clostridia bacterium]